MVKQNIGDSPSSIDRKTDLIQLVCHLALKESISLGESATTTFHFQPCHHSPSVTSGVVKGLKQNWNSPVRFRRGRLQWWELMGSSSGWELRLSSPNILSGWQPPLLQRVVTHVWRETHTKSLTEISWGWEDSIITFTGTSPTVIRSCTVKVCRDQNTFHHYH